MAIYNDLITMYKSITSSEQSDGRANAVDANDACEECGSSFGIFVWRHVCDSCSRIRCDACVPECESSETRLCSHCLPNAETAGARKPTTEPNASPSDSLNARPSESPYLSPSAESPKQIPTLEMPAQAKADETPLPMYS